MTVLTLPIQESTTFGAARGGDSLGNEAITSSNVVGPADGTTDGRRITMSAVNDGDVTGTGTASHWAITNSTVLLATGSLSATQAVTNGNKFTLGAFDITIRDAT